MSRRQFRLDNQNINTIANSKPRGASLPFSESFLRTALLPYGVTLTSSLAQAVRRYVELLLLWNKKVNLTSITRPGEILARHFGESMFACTLVPLRSGRLADVGSGAGFPGIPIKLLVPGIELLLIEPNLKKSAFLAEVVRTLGLSGVEIARARIENLVMPPGHFDFVTSRAVGHVGDLLAWSRNVLSARGQILLWLGESDAHMAISKAGWKWNEPARIPGSDRRVILVGAKHSV